MMISIQYLNTLEVKEINNHIIKINQSVLIE